MDYKELFLKHGKHVGCGFYVCTQEIQIIFKIFSDLLLKSF